MIKSKLIDIKNALIIKEYARQEVFENTAKRVVKKWEKHKEVFEKPIDIQEATEAIKELDIAGLYSNFMTGSLVFRHILEEIADSLEIEELDFNNIDEFKTDFSKAVIKKRYEYIKSLAGEQKGKIVVLTPSGNIKYIAKSQLVKYGKSEAFRELYVTRANKTDLISTDLGIAIATGQMVEFLPDLKMIEETSTQIIENILYLDTRELSDRLKNQDYISDSDTKTVQTILKKAGKRNIISAYCYKGYFISVAETNTGQKYVIMSNSKTNIPSFILKNLPSSYDTIVKGGSFSLNENELVFKNGDALSISTDFSMLAEELVKRINLIQNAKYDPISKDDQKSLISVLASIDKHYPKYELRSVLVTTGNRLVATDTRSLHIVDNVGLNVDKDTLIGGEAIRASKGAEFVSFSENEVILRHTDYTLMIEVSNGKFPDYKRIENSQLYEQRRVIVLDSKEFKDIIINSKKSETIKLEEQGSFLEVSIINNVEELTFLGKCEIKENNNKGDKINMFINAGKLNDFSYSDSNFRLDFLSKDAPLTIVSGREKYVVMPIIF